MVVAIFFCFVFFSRCHSFCMVGEHAEPQKHAVFYDNTNNT